MNSKVKMLHLSALMAATGMYLATAASVYAQAQENCGPRSQVLQRLASNYVETRQSIGIGTNDSLIEVFASTETGTWTITMTRADGVACLIPTGQSFETLVEVLPANDSEA